MTHKNEILKKMKQMKLEVKHTYVDINKCCVVFWYPVVYFEYIARSLGSREDLCVGGKLKD